MDATDVLLGNRFLYLAAFNLTLGLMTLTLTLMAARRAGAGWAEATAGVVLGFCGTSLLPYAMLHVSSEAPSTLAFLGLVLVAWAGRRDRRSFFAVLGALAGLSMGLRTQNAFAALPIMVLAAWEQVRRGPWAETWPRLASMGLATGVSVLPVLAANWVMTGSPLTSPVNFTLPDGSNPYFEPWPSHILELFFSPYHGLFIYQPLWLLGLAGAGLWMRRDLKSLGSGPGRLLRMINRPLPKNLPYPLLLCLLIQVTVYASTRFWHAGTWSFGGRYFTALAPLASLGLVYLLHVARHERTYRPLLLLAWLLATYTVLLYAPGTAYTDFVNWGQLYGHLQFSLATIWHKTPWLPVAWPLLMILGTWGGASSWSPQRRQALAALCLVLWGLAFPLALPRLYPATLTTTGADWALVAALCGTGLAAFAWRLGRGGGMGRTSRALLALLWLAWCLWPVIPAEKSLRVVAANPTLDARPRWSDPKTGRSGIVTFEASEMDDDDPQNPRLRWFKPMMLPPPSQR
jgi:hypothetical protein